MPRRYVPLRRDQRFLLPPDMSEWLDDDDLALFLIETVGRFDLSPFHDARPSGAGRPSFDPEMMVTLLLYAYARGIRSSRAIESALRYDIGFKVVAATLVPDHSTISRFRARFERAIEALFAEVLELCVESGLVRPQVVAIDGTKIGADASGAKNIDIDQLRDYARRTLEEAAAIDAAEDEAYGKDKRGDELREDLRDPEALQRWLDEKLGPKDKPKKVNMTDPSSRVMKTPGGFIQGYNVQVAVTQDQIVLGAAVTNERNDCGQLVPMITTAADNLARAGGEGIEIVVADNGYLSEANLDAGLGVDLLIAPTSKRHLQTELDALVPDTSMMQHQAKLATAETEMRRRIEILTLANERSITMREAKERIGLSTSQTYVLAKQLREKGVQALQPKKLPRPPRPSSKRRMLERFSQPGALETYALRARTVEPVFGHIKHNRGFRRFMRRGQAACNSEFMLLMTVHNLMKLHRSVKDPTRKRSVLLQPAIAT